MKSLIKRLIRVCGYEVIKAYRTSTRISMEESLKHIAHLGFRPSVIVDVGAAYGTDDLLAVFPNTRYLWIEPLQEFKTHLKRLEMRYKGEYLIAACGRHSGKVTINIHPNLTGSSILQEADGKDADGVPREVQMYRLDDLIEKYDLRSNVLLKVDVQGAELEVLDGSESLLDNCEVIILEVSFFKFLQTNPEVFDVMNYMKHRGFVAYDLFGGTNRLFDGALAQKDILFVKEEGMFRKSHRWATSEQRQSYLSGYGKHNIVKI